MSIDFTNAMKHANSYLTTDEIEKMLQWCYSKNRIRDYMLILTVARTGRRITEVLGEKPYTRKVGFRPVDIHNNLIHFDILKKSHVKERSAKTGVKRNQETIDKLRLKKMPKRVLIPVDDEYLQLINSYIEANNITSHNRIFPITRQRADIIIKEVAKGCNISRSDYKIHFHMLRHSYAIHFIKSNPKNPSALIMLQELLAHSNINVTRHYLQFNPEDKIKALNKLYNKEEKQ